jgi:hypothetical protein
MMMMTQDTHAYVRLVKIHFKFLMPEISSDNQTGLMMMMTSARSSGTTGGHGRSTPQRCPHIISLNVQEFSAGLAGIAKRVRQKWARKRFLFVSVQKVPVFSSVW